MKKITGALLSIVILSFGLMLLFNKSPETDGSTFESAPEVPKQQTEDDNSAGPSVDDEPMFTSDEFDHLSPHEQDEMLEDFVLDFWAKELGLAEPDVEEKNLSLEIFNLPYMRTLTEREFFQLSTEDQERAMADITEDCREIRSYVMDVVAEAESCMADKDYANEAYYVHSLEVGRELSVDKEGLFITRLVGIACEKAGLNGLVKLYTRTGDNAKVQMARDQLSEIESEVEEMRKSAKESEARS